MFPLIFWRVRTFSGNSPKILCPKPKTCLFPKQVKTKKKKGLHPKSIGVCVREVYWDNFMINNNMSVPEYVFAQQSFSCAQSLKFMYVRTRPQLRRNTAQHPYSKEPEC